MAMMILHFGGFHTFFHCLSLSFHGNGKREIGRSGAVFKKERGFPL
jgi:hypothetical protein